jgi:hypothetical protein
MGEESKSRKMLEQIVKGDDYGCLNFPDQTGGRLSAEEGDHESVE